MRAWVLVAGLLLAGCASAPSGPTDAGPGSTMTFETRVVRAAVATANDLYEPYVLASSTGALYLTAHVAGADTTRTPAFVSRDGGRTWAALPSHVADPSGDPAVATLTAPGAGQADEGVIVADDAGKAWMFDNGVQTAPLYGYCDDGRTQCSFDPDAWDTATNAAAACGAAPLVDRPWAAYGHGRILLVVNAGSRQTRASGENNLQLGVVDPATGAKAWNMCAGEGDIPGQVAARDSDGMFAVPQTKDGQLFLRVGLDIMRPRAVGPLGPAERLGLACGQNGANNARAAFDRDGTLYVAFSSDAANVTVWASRDLERFASVDVGAGGDVTQYWISAGPRASGALLSFTTSPTRDCNAPVDAYAAHVALGEDGAPRVRDLSLAARGIAACGDLLASTVGPDGSAFLAAETPAAGGLSPCAFAPGSTPLAVLVQTGGPRLT